ncbi:outer membrane lipoprotein-sorting protein [Thiolapillus sp.]
MKLNLLPSLVLLGLLPLKAVLADDPQARDIARDVYFVNHFFAVDNISYGSKRHPMQLFNQPSRGKGRGHKLERHLNNRYDKGDIKARDLVIFRSGQLRSTGILVDIYKDAGRPLSFAIWLPALRKIRRHSEPDQADIWGGSVFTYGDIYLRKPSDERHELLGRVEFSQCLGSLDDSRLQAPDPWCGIKGKEVLKLRSYPRKSGWWYDWRDQYIDPESHADYRSEYFKDGRKIKIIDKAWKSMGLADPRGQYWRYWYGINLRTGARGMAWVAEDQVRWNQKVKNSLWSLATLRKLSR